MHDTGPLHPERPARLRAANQGVEDSGVIVEPLEAEPIAQLDLGSVHTLDYVDAIRRFCASGGGDLDADTPASEGSWEAALSAAGAGPTAVRRMAAGFDGPALVTVRPPGHHALADRAMGFCLFNNIAVTADLLRRSGSRVAILDWDVHHGNGTQAMFYDDPNVLYISIHQYPFYPHEGAADEVGVGDGVGTTINVPLPAFTAGDVYREAFDDLAMKAMIAFKPDWLLISAGFDGHAHDPLAELRLVEADYAHMAGKLAAVVPANRQIAFLEGGYHLPAIRDSVAAVVRAMLDKPLRVQPSPFHSPELSYRALGRVRGALSGRVVGID